jgi:hypothetical protein
MKRLFFFILIVLVINLDALAQKSPVKFEKIDKADLEMNSYKSDTSAAAVILCDYGRSYFIYTEKDNFQIVFEHHRRIKVLKKAGYDWANVAIKFYHTGNSGREKVGSIKANTYNLVKGKIIKDKLSKKDQFTENISRNWSAVKFTFPNVKEGSIVEYKYSIKSDFVFNYRNWQFQYSIPVLWSEYTASIPEFFNYNKSLKGYEPLAITDKDRISKKFRYTVSSKNKVGILQRGESTRTGSSQSEFDVLTDIGRWAAKDMPAFKKEAHITTLKNYISKIEFELSSIKFPNSIRQDYTNSWESINKKLLEDSSFGHQISDETLAAGSGFLQDAVEQIKSEYVEPKERMVAAYEYVKEHMKWDEYNSKYVRTSLRKAYKDKSGNSGDINLLLTLLFSELGLNAEPVIISTRNNGQIHPSHPVLSKFNYVISKVEINGEQFMMDATDPLYQINMLPFKCLNGQGRIVSKTNSDWIDLYSNKPKKTTSMYELSVDKDGIFTGKTQTIRLNYSAYEFRKMLERADNQDEIIEDVEKNNNGLDISNYKFENIDKIYEPIKEEYEVTINDQADAFGDMIYFNPNLYDQIEKNPFKLSARKYPVDYGYLIHKTNVYKYKIPEGYTVEEVPKNISLALPENAAKFVYRVGILGDIVQLTCIFNINKTLFLPAEYDNLKSFYSQIIAKQAEQIVLKKQAE